VAQDYIKRVSASWGRLMEGEWVLNAGKSERTIVEIYKKKPEVIQVAEKFIPRPEKDISLPTF